MVTVYWRPGCPYCARLRENLRVLGVPTREINIWADKSAAATVRELAGGSETVPTVVIGGRGYVNPPASAVLAEVRRTDPGFAPDQNLTRVGRRLRLLRVIQWLVIGALIVASFALESAGHSGLSWGLDGAVVAVYLAFRLVRRRGGATRAGAGQDRAGLAEREPSEGAPRR